VTTYSERILLIAQVIEKYLIEHPRAADTPNGICRWWVASQGHDESLAGVQLALDYLVNLKRLSRTVLADGTTIYAAERSPNSPDFQRNATGNGSDRR
jgi:hypothetical protein